MDPNQLNDESLNTLLRDVAVPENLQDQLQQIPLAEGRRLDQRRLPWWRTSYGKSLALAATIFCMTAFFTWNWLNNPDTANTQTIGKHDKQKSLGGKHGADDETGHILTNDRLADAVDVQSPTDEPAGHSIDTLLHEIELARLRDRLAALDRQTNSSLASREFQSIVQAVANQSSLELGGDRARIRRNMLGLIDQYPNTRGADYARHIIDNSIEN